MLNKARIAVLVSGGGTNLEALLNAQEAGALPHGEIVLVLSSNPEAYALERAKRRGVPAIPLSRKQLGQEPFEAALMEALTQYRVDLVVLAGFLSILSADFVRRWPDRIVNVHPSLIPAFCGKGYYGLKVHEAALPPWRQGHRRHRPSGERDPRRGAHPAAEGGGHSARRHAGNLAAPGHGTGGVGAAAPGRRTAGRPHRHGKGGASVKQDLCALLRGNPYPGRGIVLGMTPDGKSSVAVYFIMGRSANSRNRVFAEEPDGIRTQAADPARMEDPSLIIYHPVRQMGRGLIVTNGDQTDTILEFLKQGLPMEQALRTREFEPDGPNWTPRISGLLGPNGSYKLSILKAADGTGRRCLRQTFEYPGQPGTGHFLHTYAGDGDPLPSFAGEPEQVAVEGDIDSLASAVWDALDEANRISLFVRFTDLETRDFQQRIVNKYSGKETQA